MKKKRTNPYKEANEAFLAVKAQEEGIVVLDNGVLYKVLEEADEPVEYCCAEPEMPMSASEAKPKRRPGRIASLFRLNKAKYVEMKEEG